MAHVLQGPRNGPAVRVLSPQRTAHGHGRLRVESTRAGTRCRRGGRALRDPHGRDAVVGRRQLPGFAVPVVVALRPTRARGPSWAGRPPPPPRGAWDEPRRPTTTADAPWAWRRWSPAPLAQAARTRGLSEDPRDGSLDRWMAREGDGTAGEGLGGRGRDEIALTRGPRDGVALGTAPRAGGGGASLAGRAARQQEPGAAFRRASPAPRRRTRERAGTAREEGVVSPSAAEVPGAELGSARWPGARAYRDGAAAGRPPARQRLKRARPQAA